MSASFAFVSPEWSARGRGYFNRTEHRSSIAGSHGTDDIEKATGS